MSSSEAATELSCFFLFKTFMYTASYINCFLDLLTLRDYFKLHDSLEKRLRVNCSCCSLYGTTWHILLKQSFRSSDWTVITAKHHNRTIQIRELQIWKSIFLHRAEILLGSASEILIEVYRTILRFFANTSGDGIYDELKLHECSKPCYKKFFCNRDKRRLVSVIFYCYNITKKFFEIQT